ncbi:bifunctional metallophosphatase/5'-nucleotidase [Paenibacillus pinihumi]|uniref:bifunctional metallophosphatase/5'-nucleotidase n=1 Tax=Paenibacillus pinihumi TaxID=669462 RepID=UPI00048A7285|nr:bifunctional metallophosphatase/5'-nucleotidase [Paenibacillus pinihumi]
MTETRNEITCTILATSDIHGHLYPTDYRSKEELPLGLAKIATMIRKERELHPDLLLIDNGDLIQGTPLASYAVKYKEGIHPAIEACNALQYDAAVPGNHEFNYGLEVLKGAIEDSSFPWLSAGIVDAATGEPAFGKPYLIKQAGEGIRVAILGVTTHYIPNWEHAHHIQGLQFRDALESVKWWAAHIREVEAPDLLIVAYHGGFERDMETGEAAERLTGENQAYAICREAEGIDVLITGHQHRLIADEVCGVAVVQPGSGGQALGKIEVSFVREGGRWVITGKRAELLTSLNSIPADETILELASGIESATQEWLDQTIGHVDGNMTVADPFVCRIADNPFMEFVNRVQLESAGVSVSNAALLNEASKGFGPVITLRDVLTYFMYPNTLVVLRLTGQDIRDALEQTAAYFRSGENGTLEVNPAYLAPKAQHYNYDMWEGIRYELDIARPAGERVSKLQTMEGADIHPHMEFEVVMNNYRANGGGDYEMYKGKPVVQEILTDMADLVAEYIIRQGTVISGCDHNWQVIVSAGYTVK